MPTPWVIKMSRDHRRRLGLYDAAQTPWYRAGGAPIPWAAYQPKGAASLAASYLDLSGNGNDCGPGTAPTWDTVNGWKFDGSTQYLLTGATLGAAWTVLCQYTNLNVVGNPSLFGSYNAGFTQAYRIKLSSSWVQYTNNGDAFDTGGVGPAASGNLGIAGLYGCRNGVIDSAALPGITGPILNLIISGEWLGWMRQPADTDMSAFGIWPSTLTTDQLAAVALAMAAL